MINDFGHIRLHTELHLQRLRVRSHPFKNDRGSPKRQPQRSLDQVRSTLVEVQTNAMFRGVSFLFHIFYFIKSLVNHHPQIHHRVKGCPAAVAARAHARVSPQAHAYTPTSLYHRSTSSTHTAPCTSNAHVGAWRRGATAVGLTPQSNGQTCRSSLLQICFKLRGFNFHNLAVLTH